MFQKTPAGRITKHKPSKYLVAYLEAQGVILPDDFMAGEATDNGVSASETLEDSNNQLGGEVVENQENQVVQAVEPTMVPNVPNLNPDNNTQSQ